MIPIHKSSQIFSSSHRHRWAPIVAVKSQPSPLSSHRHSPLTTNRHSHKSFQVPTVADELPSSPLRANRRRWAPIVAIKLPPSPLSSHRRRWSSVKSQPSAIKLNSDPSHSFEPVTIRLPGDPSHSFEPAILHIPLNRQPFAFPATVRLPSNRRPFVTKSSISSRWPFAFLPSGPLSL